MSRIDHYTLVGHRAVPEPDLIAWAQWFGRADRHVGRDKIGDAEVSTVFLGLDHSFGDAEGPLIFETMVFGGPLSDECVRYADWDSAEAGHREMCERVREAQS